MNAQVIAWWGCGAGGLVGWWAGGLVGWWAGCTIMRTTILSSPAIRSLMSAQLTGQVADSVSRAIALMPELPNGGSLVSVTCGCRPFAQIW
jgi:hypothetical protein